jgi:Flp pilus assembly protein TadD/ADP-heptose:LPS heptosyltransferase
MPTLPQPDGYSQAQELAQLGNSYLTQGKAADAESAYRSALTRTPQDAQLLNNLAVALAEQSRFDGAIETYQMALQVNPEFPDALYNLGNAYRETREFSSAVECYQKALRVNPNWPSAINNLGLTYLNYGDVSSAESCYRHSLLVQPRSALALNGLGLALQRQGHIHEALKCFDRAIEFDNNLPNSHVNRAQIWLLQGRFPEGWNEYQWRWHLPQSRVDSSVPFWMGQSLRGKRILLWKEQGFGDTFQFIRFATKVKQLGAEVTLQCPARLHSILSDCEGIDRFVESTQQADDFDFHSPLLNLPLVFGVEEHSIPNACPYISPKIEQVKKWRKLLDRGPLQKKRTRVGIAWIGSADYPEDCHRSIPLQAFDAFADIDAEFISLQLGSHTAEIAARSSLDIRQIDLHETEGAFTDTAGVIENLDLVITADTSIGHLSAAMGKPTWIALTKTPDWRWLLARNDSPWYPSVRLYRQETLDDWSLPFDQIATDLSEFARRRKSHE